jgi:uncharacterized membrane protein YoaT (DUF817 family)
MILIPVSIYLLKQVDSLRQLRVAHRIGAKLAFFAFSWDFFAIQLGAWRYPRDPGPALYGVPLNDLVLIWICSQFSVTIFIVIIKRQRLREGHPEREYASEHDV